MRSVQYKKTAIFFLLLSLIGFSARSQQGININIKKPKEYDERVLPSEKSDQKKFTLPRRFIQNTTTRYNYFFNANNRLNEVLEKAKSEFVDDYSVILPFYNYTLDATAQDSIRLDSITYKASTGIALHDLRNDWADNLYLLWGASFYLQKKFDSASLMFQFINYAFAEKEKDGYYKTIGSSMDGNSALSISTKEKQSLPRKIFALPPSRNDAFIWQIRNFLAQDKFAESASLIATLRTDPNFPKRLKNDLDEVQAYWFYKQHMWDSSVVHLVAALDNAGNLHEKARWEYLVAQMYERIGNYKDAEKYFTKVANHTTDPVLDIYARLYSIRVNKDGGEKYIEKNIAELEKMARRDKYQDYRDIIYYMAAQMQLERNDIDAALALLIKSTQYPSNDMFQRNRAFLQIADLYYQKRKYRLSYNYYDSLRLDDPNLKDVPALTAKKELLGIMATQVEIIERQDSLQLIAAMPEEARKSYVEKLVKDIRKKQGLKDEPVQPLISPFATVSGSPNGRPDNKGEWYFYNAAYRSRGQNDFKIKWGNRVNQDNWRRSSASGISSGANNNNLDNTVDENGDPTTDPAAAREVSVESLISHLPVTEALLQQSNDSINNAMFELGKLYIQDVEDCVAGTDTLEKLRERAPSYPKMDEILFNLYYCYNKHGETARASTFKNELTGKYPSSNFTSIVNTGRNPLSKGPNPEATQAYEKIYDLFIEGNFNEAIAMKRQADSTYGKNYWTPQLLYIESVYYIKQRDDSTATNSLKAIISEFNGTPIAEKATTMLDVLSRRAQIEEELRNLVIQRPADDNNVRRDQPIVTAPLTVTPKKDSIANPTVALAPKKDSIITAPVQKPVAINNPPPKDTATKKIAIAPPSFSFSADVPHYAVLILDKVDPVFSNEAKNAFFRYNRETYSNKIMSADLVELDGNVRLLLISPFKNAQEAADYVEKTKPRTASEIIPWLKGGKYSFSIISDRNLDALKASKDIEKYRSFLNQNMPGKF